MKLTATLLAASFIVQPAIAAPPSKFGLTGTWIVYQNDAFEGVGGQGLPVAAALPNDPDIIGITLSVSDDIITMRSYSKRDEFNETCVAPDIKIEKLHRKIDKVDKRAGQRLAPSLFENRNYTHSLSIDCQKKHFGPYPNETIYPISQDRFIIIWWNSVILKFRRASEAE